MGIGKWIAGVLGWAMFGPIGGILGYYFVSRIEKATEGASGYDEDQRYNQGQQQEYSLYFNNPAKNKTNN